MAKEPRREQPSSELKAEIARSRDRFARDLRVFRREIDIPRRIKRSSTMYVLLSVLFTNSQPRSGDISLATDFSRCRIMTDP